LRELDVVVADDLDAVAPWVEEIEEAPRQHLDAGFPQGAAHSLLVIDHQSEVPTVIGGLPAALLKGEELVAEVDERGVVAPAAQLEIEQPTVEFQRRVDVADLDRHVIETDRAGFPGLGHGSLHVRSDMMWCDEPSPAIGACAAPHGPPPAGPTGQPRG